MLEPLQSLGGGRTARDLSLDEIDPIITLQVTLKTVLDCEYPCKKTVVKTAVQVRAYDLGIPSLDSQVPVNIFTQDVQSRSFMLTTDISNSPVTCAGL